MTTLTSSADSLALVPGDVGACRIEATALNTRSQDYDTLDETLRSAAARVEWSGLAYEAFVDCVAFLRKRVQRASDDFARASSALAQFAFTLEWGQREAARAIAMWAAGDREEKDSTASASLPGLVRTTSPKKHAAQSVLDDAANAVDAAERIAAEALRELAASAPRSIFAAAPRTTMTGRDGGGLLDSLSLLYGANLGLYLARHPDLLAELSALGAPAIATWWSTLSEAQKTDLMRRAPEVIGNLDGVPYGYRDRANVSRLKELAAEARQGLDPERAKAIEWLLERYGDGLGPTRQPPEFLLSLDTTAPGIPLAQLAVGDLDTATTANWLVPGMNSSLLEANNYLRAVTNLNFGNHSSATVLFVGYESPKLLDLDVFDGGKARVGANRLAEALAGYNAVRDQAGLTSQLTVIGHSYGTTVVTNALSPADLRVDNVILVASAGVEHGIAAQDLHAHDGVYVTEGLRDDVADVGRIGSHRSDPRDAAFGGHLFGSDGARLPDGTELAGVTGHNAVGGSESDDRGHYFGKGTESLWNMQHIIEGGRIVPPLTLAPGISPVVPPV